MVTINKFYFKLFITDRENIPIKYLGNAFPLTSDGGFLTCKHVINVKLDGNQNVAIYDNELNKYTIIPNKSIITLDEHDIDLAFIDNALQRNINEFWPILTPSKIIIGSELSTFGYFMSGNSLEPGYFNGHIINIFIDEPTHITQSMRLPFPILEGMSGCPLSTYHNGTKLVGIGYGNRQSRILASEIIEYKDEKLEYREKIHRIIEYGIAYHSVSILYFLERIKAGNYVVSEDRLEIPGL